VALAVARPHEPREQPRTLPNQPALLRILRIYEHHRRNLLKLTDLAANRGWKTKSRLVGMTELTLHAGDLPPTLPLPRSWSSSAPRRRNPEIGHGRLFSRARGWVDGWTGRLCIAAGRAPFCTISLLESNLHLLFACPVGDVCLSYSNASQCILHLPLHLPRRLESA
jgi:hypothetical protein